MLEEFKTPKNFNENLSEIDVFDISIPYLARLIDNASKYLETEVNVLLQDNKYERQTVNLLVVNPVTGLPYTEREYRYEFYRLQEFVGVQNPVPPKQLRHTAAKVFKQAGIDVSVFSKQLTHSDDKTTEKFYSGITPCQNSKEEVTTINTKMNKLLPKAERLPSFAKKDEKSYSSRRFIKLIPAKTNLLDNLSPHDVGPLVRESNTA